MAKLHVHTKFRLRHDDGTTTDYAPGEHDFDDKLADHWYVKLHTREPDAAGAPTLDDTGTLDELEADLVAKEKELAEREAKLNALASELDSRATDLDEREAALNAAAADLAVRLEAFETAQREAAAKSSEQSTDKAGPSQSNQSAKKR